MNFKNIRNVRSFLSDYYLGSIFGRGERRNRRKRLSDRDTDVAYARFRRIRDQAEGRADDATECRERFLRPLFRDVLGFHVGAGANGVHALFANAELENQGASPIALLVCGRWDDDPASGTRTDRNLTRRLEDALAGQDLPYGFVGTGEEIRLLRRQGYGPRGSYIAADLNGLAEDDDPESFAVGYKLFHISMFKSEEDGCRPLDLIEIESRAHAQQVSDDLKRAVFSAAEILVTALIADSTRREGIKCESLQDFHLRGYRDAALTGLYRLLFIMYAEARDTRLYEHPIYRDSYSIQSLLDEILSKPLEDSTLFAENATGFWDRVRALFEIFDQGLPEITPWQHLPPRGGDFFSSRTPEGKILDNARLCDKDIAKILICLATSTPQAGIGHERISFRELDIEQLGAVYEGLLEYEPRVVRSTTIELRVQGRNFALDPADVVRLCRQKSLLLRGDPSIVEGTTAESLHPQFALSQKDEDEYALSTADEDDLEAVPDDESDETEEQDEAGIRRGASAALVRRFLPGTFHFVAGAARKGSGSFYTPLPLVRDLIEHALAPIAQGRSVNEIESLRILDPACGSAHFLVEAMRYLGHELHRAYVRELGSKAPAAFRNSDRWDSECGLSDAEARSANSEARAWCKRRIAEKCLFGVDKNPTAINLARVALWIESLAGDRPLTFFEHHIRPGNSLLGSWLSGITRPPLIDNEVGPTNTQAVFHSASVIQLIESAADARRLIDRAVDLGTVEPDSIAEQNFKAHQRDLAEGSLYTTRLLFDLRMASSFIPTIWADWQELLNRISDRNELEKYASHRSWWNEFLQVQQRERFFHWELEFPEAFCDKERRGFDVVLGNPPWDKVLPTKHEFYAHHDVLIRAFKSSELDSRIRELHEAHPGLEDEFKNYRTRTVIAAQLLRKSGDFPLSEARSQATHEDLSKYFVDRAIRLCADSGAGALVVPSVLYSGDGFVGIRRFLLEKAAIERFYGFENRRKIFPIDCRYKFVNLVFRKGKTMDGFDAAFMRHDISELAAREEKPWLVRITREEVTRLTPDTLAFLEYRGPRDQAIINKMHRSRPILGGKGPTSWGAEFFTDMAHMQIYNSTRDKDLWTDPESKRFYSPSIVLGAEPNDPAQVIRAMRKKGFWPVFEGKHIDQFLVGVKPIRWWLSVAQAEQKYARRPRQEPTLVFRETASNTNERTCIAAVLPSESAASHKLSGLILSNVSPEIGALVLNSFSFDFALRRRTAGTNVSFTYMRPMPVPGITEARRLASVSITTRSAWIDSISHITENKGWWPMLWEANRSVAEAYSLSPDDLDYILNEFPVFARKRPDFFSYLKAQIQDWRAEITGEFRLQSPATLAETTSRRPPKKTPKSDRFNQAAVLAFIVNELGRTDIGRVGHDKLIYFAQEHLGIDLGLTFSRKAAGPWDPALKHQVEKLAISQRWLVIDQRAKGDTASFRVGPDIATGLVQANRKLGSKVQELRDLCQFFNGVQFGNGLQFRTAGLERWATIHKCWKDLLRNHPVTETTLIEEVLNWKPHYKIAEVRKAIGGMVKYGLIQLARPEGNER